MKFRETITCYVLAPSFASSIEHASGLTAFIWKFFLAGLGPKHRNHVCVFHGLRLNNLPQILSDMVDNLFLQGAVLNITVNKSISLLACLYNHGCKTIVWSHNALQDRLWRHTRSANVIDKRQHYETHYVLFIVVLGMGFQTFNPMRLVKCFTAIICAACFRATLKGNDTSRHSDKSFVKMRAFPFQWKCAFQINIQYNVTRLSIIGFTYIMPHELWPALCFGVI